MKRIFTLPLVLAGSCYALYMASPALSNSNTIANNKANDGQIGQTKTYIWGNGAYQPKPDAQNRFRNFEPKLIKTFLGQDKVNLRDVSFGDHHEGGIDINGNAYIWNKHRQDSSYSEGDDVRDKIICLDDSKDNRQMSFSKGNIWVLKENGDVYQYDIIHLVGNQREKPKILINQVPKKVEELKDIAQIASGDDHFAAVDVDGFVWTFGDDTLGQCGHGAQRRNCAPPFFEKRIKKPQRVSRISNITKVVCGGNHTLALNEDGVVYGWGSNSHLQLSHEMEFSLPENPMLAVFAPLRFEKNLGPIVITDIAAGDEFSVFVGKNRYNRESEVFACGRNLHGELGAGNLSHVQEVVKLESMSNYKVKSADGETDIKVEQISCGKNHCMALLNIGALLTWGANEHGQLGNRKRVFSENPIVVKDLAEEKVLKISCGHSNSAVICDANAESTLVNPKINMENKNVKNGGGNSLNVRNRNNMNKEAKDLR